MLFNSCYRGAIGFRNASFLAVYNRFYSNCHISSERKLNVLFKKITKSQKCQIYRKSPDFDPLTPIKAVLQTEDHQIWLNI